MTTHHDEAWKELAHTKPAQALVMLWLQLRDHGRLEEGLERDACEQQAREFQTALENGDPLPSDVHPFAAVRALSEFLYVWDSGRQPLFRKVPGGKRLFWLVQRRTNWTSILAEGKAGHLEYWLRRYQIFPLVNDGIHVDVRHLPVKLQQAREEKIHFLAGGFPDDVFPDWTANPLYRCEVLADPSKRWQSVLSVLEAAADASAAIVLFPELTIDAEVRQKIREWLREQDEGSSLILVLAGSFHEQVGAPPKGRNIAYLYDGRGTELLQHVKLRPMRTKKNGKTIDEGITGGSHVTLFYAWFGLVGIAICLDFCETAGIPIAKLWGILGPALMLVPSMGEDKTNDAHAVRARELHIQHGTYTIVASQHPDLPDALGLSWIDGVANNKHPILEGDLLWLTQD